jgi:class 3 adenylate cyclase
VFAFLFTDIEGSTALLQRVGGDVYARVLADHHGLIRSALAAHGGSELNTAGDGFSPSFRQFSASAKFSYFTGPVPASACARVLVAVPAGVDVLLRIYVRCVVVQDELAKRRPRGTWRARPRSCTRR